MANQNIVWNSETSTYIRVKYKLLKYLKYLPPKLPCTFAKEALLFRKKQQRNYFSICCLSYLFQTETYKHPIPILRNTCFKSFHSSSNKILMFPVELTPFCFFPTFCLVTLKRRLFLLPTLKRFPFEENKKETTGKKLPSILYIFLKGVRRFGLFLAKQFRSFFYIYYVSQIHNPVSWLPKL